MIVQDFIGNEMDLLVVKLKSTKTEVNLAWDAVKVMEKEKEDLQVQLFRYAEDIQKLLSERDVEAINENEKHATYKQLERFNKDFMILFEQKEKSYKALESSHLDTIRRLATAAEFKDDDTGVHIVRMSRFSCIIARAYGQDEKFCHFSIDHGDVFAYK